MWVLAQNREYLVEVKCVYLDDNIYKNGIIADGFFKGDLLYLASYENDQERFEVFEKLQLAIKKGQKLFCFPEEGFLKHKER